MLNLKTLMINTFVEELKVSYNRSYGNFNTQFRDIIEWAGWMALENIANSDGLYHNVSHTIMVTSVGQEILRGKHLIRGGVTAEDWMHFIISLLCHDIGYVKGICKLDKGLVCATGKDNETITLPKGSTDAALTPYHVDRGKLFIRERFGGHVIIHAERIVANIELTRFPVPDGGDYQEVDNYPGLLRSADLIGQLADPDYIRKLPALYYEFEETGTNKKLGYKDPDDLREGYAKFFWYVVHPYINQALQYLSLTQEGKQWISNLYKHVFEVEHIKEIGNLF